MEYGVWITVLYQHNVDSILAYHTIVAFNIKRV